MLLGGCFVLQQGVPMKKSIVKSTAAFSALGCVLVVLSAVVEFFLFVELSKEWGFKYGAIWGIVG